MKNLLKNLFKRRQKVTEFILWIMCMLFAGGTFSFCENRYEFESGGDVPYKPCPCENNYESLGTIKGETRLFIDENFEGTDYMRYLSYYPDLPDYFADHAFLCLKGDHPQFPGIAPEIPAVINICNFPDFAKKWKTSGGIDVCYEGIVYPNCEEFGCRTMCYTLIITKLKIK